MTSADAIVVDYGMGNVGSILNMGRAAGANLRPSSSAGEISEAAKLILPGVGAFDKAIESLSQEGLIEALNYAVLERKAPILGICLGMQLFTQRSEEGELPGLGWIAAKTVRFDIDAADQTVRVPHMGWNTIEIANPSKLFQALPSEPRFYFVHSYHVSCDNQADVLAWTNHGYQFASMICRDNILGVQFHPEKSSRFGLGFLRGFLSRDQF